MAAAQQAVPIAKDNVAAWAQVVARKATTPKPERKNARPKVIEVAKGAYVSAKPYHTFMREARHFRLLEYQQDGFHVVHYGFGWIRLKLLDEVGLAEHSA